MYTWCAHISSAQSKATCQDAFESSWIERCSTTWEQNVCFLRVVFLCFHCMLLPTVLAVGTWEDQAFSFSHTCPQHMCLIKFRCNQSDSCWIMPFYGLHRQWFLGISKEQRMDSSMMFDVISRIRSAQHNIAWESETCVLFPRKSLHVVIRNHRQSCSVTPTVSGWQACSAEQFHRNSSSLAGM